MTHRLLYPKFYVEAARTDATAKQLERAAYDEPDASPAWLRPYYVCGRCGYERVVNAHALVRVRVPHRCQE